MLPRSFAGTINNLQPHRRREGIGSRLESSIWQDQDGIHPANRSAHLELAAPDAHECKAVRSSIAPASTWTGRVAAGGWKRGAATARCMPMPWSITLRSVWNTEVGMVEPPGRTHHHEQFLVPRDDRGCHGRQHALAWGDGIRLTAHKPIRVRCAGGAAGGCPSHCSIRNQRRPPPRPIRTSRSA